MHDRVFSYHTIMGTRFLHKAMDSFSVIWLKLRIRECIEAGDLC